MLLTRTKEQVLSNAVDRLETYAKNKYDFSSTSTVRLMLDTIAQEIESIGYIASDSLLNKTIDSASGSMLDLFGQILGIERMTGRSSFDNTYSTIKFYIDPGFGYNAQTLVNKIPAAITADSIDRTGGSFTINSGVRLSTNIDGLYFRTTSPITLSGSETYGFVNATSNVSGSASNISTGAIVSHNLENKQPELGDISQYILVTNISPIDSGRNRESDNNYRYRLVRAIQSNASANEVALRMVALSIPGVSDARIIKYINGLGTTGIEITGTEPIVNIGTLRAVEEECSKILACGETVEVIQPEYTTFACTVELVTNSGIAADSIKNRIKKQIMDYVLNIDKGGIIYPSRIISIAVSSDSSILAAEVTTMRIGELDIMSGSILNSYPVNPGRVQTSIYEKWYTDSSLVEVTDA